MEVKGGGWFSPACEEGLYVEEGWLVCIGIHQLSKCIRMVGATPVTFGKGNFKYGKEVNKNKIPSCYGTEIKVLHENSWVSIKMCAYVGRLIDTDVCVYVYTHISLNFWKQQHPSVNKYTSP